MANQYGLLRPSMRQAIERANDPESLVRRTIADPGQVATNVGGSALAGLLGQVGDLGQISSLLGGALFPEKQPQPSQNMPPLNRQFIPSTPDIQQALGVEQGRPESLLGEFGAPDMGDIAKAGRGLLAMTLFHGTPHKFDKFDLSRIGTGEGAQAYGHGLYFAQNPEVAGSYATKLGQFDRVGINSLDITPMPGVKISESAHMNLDEYFDLTQGDGLTQSRFDDAIADMQKRIDEYGESSLLSQADVDELKKLSVRDFRPAQGHLYEVDIPDETIDKMLDWDAPLSEQPENVRDAAQRLIDSDPTIGPDDAKYIQEKGENFYNALRLHKPDGVANLKKEGASALLNEAGIPGIRYFDGNSRSAGEGTRNIVVFDEGIINKVKRDGETVFNRADVGGGLLGARVSEAGRKFETGKPVEFSFSHNTDSATEYFGPPETGDDFMREFEPSGRYVIHNPDPRPDPTGQFISGKIRFENPLVIPNDNLNWKRSLSEAYDGKTGKELSQAIIDDGYDGVVTVDEFRGEQVTSEILDLTTFDPKKARF